ncbi:oxygen-independent coproporphyrinogen III oxidase [Dinghuibacter silviterrae]|uniref:Coproporphyrinogen-III oxidase n=1 Tax=Dinghuibacter silviterrae TaxID=1539049 RepID=A0A4R8DGR1_9BACT|nr:oxygen-independent coproporphyrinogen III oxidase [Dinghuibacter silviterrae]TDW96695.1 oxygen-independent coproporphyrinogen-3 oxidase [Dinghuibacter silviterrae]
MDLSLAEKYNLPVPRYTSYPTVPFWKEGLDTDAWRANVAEGLGASKGISLYIHLPFCESLCIYCGCNKKITTNHKVEEEYIDAVLAEWAQYLDLSGKVPVIRELHLGGGTPTFFSPDNLERLINGILSRAVVHPDHSFSLEGHPNNTTRAHLDRLYGLGFRRISFGVQDLNREVQERIHRLQPFENLVRANGDARCAGFDAVNFDLIYGLPLQTLQRLAHTIEWSVALSPDRLALYSYAHTPWLNCSQRLIDEKELPTPADKLALYEQGTHWLEALGYTNIGMDHFAKASDALFLAWKAGRLHRNFMGYTTQATGMLLGLGVSAISDTGTAFAQNDKALEGYYRSVRAKSSAVRKGYFLSEGDRVFRRHILDMACKGRTVFDPAWAAVYEEWTIPILRGMETDGLITLSDNEVCLTEKGRPFLRHACKAFDLHLLYDEKFRGILACGKAAQYGKTFSNAI